jgi:hypothetical protein
MTSSPGGCSILAADMPDRPMRWRFPKWSVAIRRVRKIDLLQEERCCLS